MVNNPPANAGNPGLIPGTGRSGEGNSNPLQYSCLENPMDRGAQWATVYGVTKESYIYIYTHTHTFFLKILISIMVYHKILNVVPYAIQ